MKIPTIAGRAGLFAATGVFVVAVLLSGCPSAEKKPAQQPPAQPKAAAVQPGPKAEPLPATEAPAAAQAASPEKDLSEEMEQAGEKVRDLGPPLVEDPENLVRLHRSQPVWIDRSKSRVVLVGEVCNADYPLEFFATYSNRAYEAVVSVNVKPSIVHAGLVAVGAEPGHPAQFQPTFVAPTGTEVAIEVRWKDASGKVQSAPAQDWIRNIKTKKALDTNWVFAGSMFVTDETTGKQYYQADSGELICVLSLPTAMLDLPIRGYGAIEARSFEAFKEHLPPPGTPVTILLKPILSKPRAAAVGKEKRAELEQKAVETAGPWLTLVDQGQYTRSWETAADYFKGAVERHDWIKSLNARRKPLGEVKSRVLESKEYVTSVPAAPDGQYVILQYKTTFANKKSATETVTPMFDRDKKWRVSGYYVK